MSVMKMKRRLPVLCALGVLTLAAWAQAPDEIRALRSTLPDPLENCPDAETWVSRRRPEILKLFQSQMYGYSPAAPDKLTFDVTSVAAGALGGRAVRKEITLRVFDMPLHLLVYLPAQAAKPVPVFVGLNFPGNHTIHADPGITIIGQWMQDDKTRAQTLTLPAASTRGKSAKRWPLDLILARGYAVATLSRVEIEPDIPDGWIHGLRGAWLRQSGKSGMAADDWGAIAAWAYGLSRALDYLETDPDIDARRVAVLGHSRLGKAALWAGAQDERFAMVISSNSGEGGAALARRRSGETTALLNQRFPHWFCANFRQYNDREDHLPFDQHELIALIAPRPVYVASAKEDLWADPLGEFLAARSAEPVYRLLGKPGLGVDDMPDVNRPVGGTIGYHLRAGPHDITTYDWEQYLDFADRHLKAPPGVADGPGGNRMDGEADKTSKE